MILIIDCGSKKSSAILSIVKDKGHEASLVSLDNFTSESIDNSVLGLIISGAPILLTELDPAPYIKQFNFLKSISIPVLGICFGHQILGLVHHASVMRCLDARTRQLIEVSKAIPLFTGIKNHKFMQDHCESISCPDGFDLIATSTNCEVEAIQHQTKKLYGVQFHPEASDSQGEQLIANFLSITCL